MTIETILDGIHASVTRRRSMQLFAAFTRVLLAIAFIPPSIPKILHQPFTLIPTTHPVGAYFDALYNTGFYYDFLGWTQLAAAALLLFPRTAHLGALMFLPIIVNIAVLTNSVGFNGTWLITIFMSLAGLFLVAWEYDRLKVILFRSRRMRPNRFRHQMIAIPLFFTAGGVTLAVVSQMLMVRDPWIMLKAVGVLGSIGLIFGVLVAIHYTLMPVGELNESDEIEVS